MERLDHEDAGRLFDSFTGGKVEGEVRERALRLLDGHPLALTWTGTLLGYEEEGPGGDGRRVGAGRVVVATRSQEGTAYAEVAS